MFLFIELRKVVINLKGDNLSKEIRKMKKVVLILVLAMAIPACIFAGSNVFNFSVGATAAYQKAGAVDALSKGDFDAFQDISIDDFKFGVDAEAKVLFFDINGKAFFAKNEDSKVIINGIVSANLAFDIAIFRIKAGLGYQYTYNLDSKKFSFGNGASGVDSFENFKTACMDVYAGFDVLLGKWAIGVYATLPTSVSIASLGEGKFDELFTTVKDNWKAAQIGVGFRYSII